jgi:hypothetical protein
LCGFKKIYVENNQLTEPKHFLRQRTVGLAVQNINRRQGIFGNAKIRRDNPVRHSKLQIK